MRTKAFVHFLMAFSWKGKEGFLRICVGGSWSHDSRNFICCILAITGFFWDAIWETRMNAMTRSKLKVLVSSNIMAKENLISQDLRC